MKELFIISSGSNIAKSKPTISNSKDIVASDKATSSKDFLTIMFAQIKEAISTNQKNVDLTPKLSTKDDSNKNTTKKSLDEHLLGDILTVISILKSTNEDKPSFPAMTQSLEKLINNDAALKDLKNISNMTDLLKLSKKYNLGLENISVKKLDLNSFKKEFPQLDKKSFFETTQKNDPKNIQSKIKPSTEIPFQNIQKPIQKTIKEPSILEKAISSSKPTKEVKLPSEVITKIAQEAKVPKETIVKIIEGSKTSKEVITKIEQETKIPKEIIVKIIEGSKTSKEVITKITQEAKVPKESKVNTANNINPKNVKTEQNVQKKGLIENVLQNIKHKKPIEKILSNSQNNQQDAEKTSNKDQKPVDKIETSTKNEFKMHIKNENISNKQAIEPKHTLNNFANELRAKIDNYKPPMMKIQMALNPKELGEVNVTLLSRGNSLHVNINSNTNSMAIFTQNQAEFKNSLVNMGFTNLEMNFSDHREQNNQQNSNNKSSSEEFTDEQENQNIDNEGSSVELIIPQYI